MTAPSFSICKSSEQIVFVPFQRGQPKGPPVSDSKGAPLQGFKDARGFLLKEFIGWITHLHQIRVVLCGHLPGASPPA